MGEKYECICPVSNESHTRPEDCWFEIRGGMLDGPINVRMSQMIHDEVAKVVLVPRRAAKRRKP